MFQTESVVENKDSLWTNFKNWYLAVSFDWSVLQADL